MPTGNCDGRSAEIVAGHRRGYAVLARMALMAGRTRASNRASAALVMAIAALL